MPSQTGERVIAVPEAAVLQCFGAFWGPFSLFNTQFHNLFQPILWTFVFRISHFLICTFACCEFCHRLCLLAASSHTFKQANVKFESHHGFLLSFFFFCRNVFFSCVERGHWPAVKVYTLNQKEIIKYRVKSWTREEKEKLSLMIFCDVCSRMSKHWKGCVDSSELTETSREREWTCICWTHVQENTVSVLAAASKKKQKVFDKTCTDAKR